MTDQKYPTGLVKIWGNNSKNLKTDLNMELHFLASFATVIIMHFCDQTK